MVKKSTAEPINVVVPPQVQAQVDPRAGMINHTVLNPDFTGVARSLQCYYNQGHNNFQILTLYIEKGKITKMHVSDPYANFEAITKLEYWNSISITNLNINWSNGKTLAK